MDIMLIIVVLVLLYFVVALGLNRLLGIKKRADIRKTEGRKVDKWSRIIIATLCLCSLPFIVILDSVYLIWYWIIYLTLLLGTQAVLEWKYIPSKQYVTTIVLWALSVVTLFCIRAYFTGV